MCRYASAYGLSSFDLNAVFINCKFHTFIFVFRFEWCGVV